MKSRASIEALADFERIFSDPRACKSTSIAPTGTGTPSDPIHMGCLILSDGLVTFIRMAYQEGWVDPSFQWNEWREEQGTFIKDQSRILSANTTELTRLITSFIRIDRFVDGYLEERLQDGSLAAITRRASSLLQPR